MKENVYTLATRLHGIAYIKCYAPRPFPPQSVKRRIRRHRYTGPFLHNNGSASKQNRFCTTPVSGRGFGVAWRGVVWRGVAWRGVAWRARL